VREVLSVETVIPGAAWQPDPTKRHQLRYHDGTSLTAYVCDDGIVAVDRESVPGDPAPEPDGVAPVVSAPEDRLRPPNGFAPPRQPPAGYGLPPSSVGTFWPGTAQPAQSKNNRVGLSIAIGIAVLEGFAILALVVALVAAHTTDPSQPIGSTVSPSGSFNQAAGAVVYSSHFGSDENWPTGSLNANTIASLSGGHYVVQAWADIHHVLGTPYSVSHQGISVEAATSDFSPDNVSMGVGCQSAAGVQPSLVYQLLVYPNGQWYIEEARLSGSVQTLTSGSTSALGAAGTLQLTCVITDTTSHKDVTQLVAYVDGSRVGAIGDQIGTSVGGYVPLLLVGSFGPRVHAAFNGIRVRSINPQSVTAP
jgi:hypothetical protein